MEQKRLLVVLPLVMYLVGSSTAQYPLGGLSSSSYILPQYSSGPTCTRLQSRHQQIRQEVIEFCETVETRISTYDNVFTQSTKSGGFLCGVKEALEDLKSVLQSCRSPSSSTWISRIESLCFQLGDICNVFTTRTYDVQRISSSVVTIKQQVREVREFVQTIDISSCDSRAESLLDQCSSRLGQLKNLCNSHWGDVSSLFSYSALPGRGRDYDGSKIGRDSYSNNQFIIKIANSKLADTHFRGFSKDETTTTNNHHYP